MKGETPFLGPPCAVQEFTIMVPSNRPCLLGELRSSLHPLAPVHWDGTGYVSFSKLVNDCIVQAPTEIVIICSDKVRPTPDHIGKILALLHQGYAFVGLYYFACFAFPKQLIRQIGFFDERFIGGEFEDCDYMVRMREANVAYYLTKEVPYLWMKSSWDNTRSRPHFIRKWGTLQMDEARRQLAEEKYPYNVGEPKPTRFLPHTFSIAE